jgi:hypothetical protein
VDDRGVDSFDFDVQIRERTLAWHFTILADAVRAADDVAGSPRLFLLG